MSTDPAAKKIRELRKSLKLNQGPFGTLIGVDQATVSRWESGAQKPEIEAVRALAKLAGTDVEDFLGNAEVRGSKVDEVEVMGKVQAGEWVEALERPREERFTILATANSRYAGIKRFGLEVVGPSMNEVYPEGTVLVCAHIEHTRKPPQHGQRVIVERKRADGLREITVKEYQVLDGQIWLIPRSTHPAFKAPLQLTPAGEHDVEEVRVIAIVTGRYQDEP